MSGLRGKIMSGYVAITALTIIMATWSAFSNVSLSGSLNAMMVQNYRSVLASSSMLGALERQDSWALLNILGEPTSADPYEGARADFLTWFGRAEDNITLPNEGAAIERIRASYLNYTSGVEAVVRAVWAGDLTTVGARDRYVAEVLPDFTETRQACLDLLTMNDEAMREVQDRTTRATRAATWTTGGVALAALLMAWVAGYTVSERITRPVRQLAESADRIARGRLDEEITVSSSDEVGLLAREFAAMLARLRELRASDMAEVVASRSKLESVIETISDGIVVLGTNGAIEVINPSARTILSLDGQDVVGSQFADVAVDPRLRALGESADDPQVGLAGPVPVDLEQPSGERGFYLAEILNVRHSGDVVGRVLLLRDVTAVEKNERAKSQFMSAVSHELRTPLTSMTISIGLLGESRLFAGAEREAGLVEILKEDTARMTRLVDELFEISRLQRGQLPMDFRAADLSQLAEGAVSPFRAQAETQGVELAVSVPSDLPTVLVDEEKIAWVISNLVGNALRYTDPGGKISVSAERHGGKVYVAVADTGHGIPKDQLEAIFEPYVQLPGGKKGGAGLGLAIARDVVRAHGGRIWAESEIGQGSVFTFSVPVEH